MAKPESIARAHSDRASERAARQRAQLWDALSERVHYGERETEWLLSELAAEASEFGGERIGSGRTMGLLRDLEGRGLITVVSSRQGCVRVFCHGRIETEEVSNASA